MDEPTRVCRKCKQRKPLSSFHKDSSRSSGYAYTCKDCLNKANSKYKKSGRKHHSAQSQGRTQKMFADQPWLARIYKIAVHENKRAREMGAEGSFTGEQFEALCNQVNWTCPACHKVAPLTADHIVPLSQGGTNDISNIQPLCISCNSSKGDATINYLEVGESHE